MTQPFEVEDRESHHPLPSTAPWRTLRRVAGLAALAVGAFHVAFLFPAWSWLVLVWLGALVALRRVPRGRWAFYSGLVVGLAMYAPQLAFFWTLFGPAAIALWLVLAFWLAVFVLCLHGVERYWGTGWALGLAPLLWLGIEFFRSELYYLRFAWFTAGSVLPTLITGPFLPWCGVYGLGALLVGFAALGVRAVESGRRGGGWRRPAMGVAVLSGLGLAGLIWLAPRLAIQKTTSVPVAGVQLEFPKVGEVLEALERAKSEAPDAELWALSEYTFDGPVPDEVRAWCRDRQRWLVAGGRDPVDGAQFRNTAFVVSTNGEVVFKQAKAVPIQFFQDGLPATEQQVWESPWGRLGICVCYDLNYARVVDRLIQRGAQALIVPTMDVEAWGRHEHRLNARLAPVRAAEYRVPILRVASSGISQLVRFDGSVVAQTSVPGRGEVITGVLSWPVRRRSGIPLDRAAGPAASLATAGILLGLAWTRWRTGLVNRYRPASLRHGGSRMLPTARSRDGVIGSTSFTSVSPACSAPCSTGC